MGKYAESNEWEDVIPIPQNDGGPSPLAAIAYTEEYSEAMSYLRAVMADNEKSERVLELTQDIIQMNPAHYTIWLYRASIVFETKRDLLQELEWLNPISLKYLKNYQIWHHRQTIMAHIETLPPNELSFLSQMFAKDVKNYHVWSYRQWLVRHFSLWDSELPFVESLLKVDVRNNSAWNHRWYIIFGRNVDPTKGTREEVDAATVEPALIERELEYTKDAIRLAPQNQSPWLYLRGVLRKKGKGFAELKGFAEEFADVDREDEVRSSHALDFLADLYAEQKAQERAGMALELLARRYDPIRRNYWNYRRNLLGLKDVQGAY